jgi:hypothetical protein
MFLFTLFHFHFIHSVFAIPNFASQGDRLVCLVVKPVGPEIFIIRGGLKDRADVNTSVFERTSR